MCKIEIEASQVAAIYKGCTSASKSALREALGDQLEDVLPVTERIQSLEDAISELGEYHRYVKSIDYVKYSSLEKDKELIAYMNLRAIVAALNNGWTPTIGKDEEEGYWFPQFEVLSKSDIEALDDEEVEGIAIVEGTKGEAGVRFARCAVVDSNLTFYNTSLALRTQELATYAGQKFLDLYAQLFVNNTPKE
jgi:hypothetical protein